MNHLSAQKHNDEIHINHSLWESKPVVQELYRGFYREIKHYLTSVPEGLTFEIGSGMGKIKEIIPECVTSDLFENPWLDRVENAYSLGLPDESVSNLILFDVWHHLEYPGSALAEFQRVLKRNGRLIIIDPYTSLLGKIVYGLFHHEPLGSGLPVEWLAPADTLWDQLPYFAAQSRAKMIFENRKYKDGYLEAWNMIDIKILGSIGYFASGGFSGPQLYPDSTYRLIKMLDLFLGRFPSIFGARMLIILEKK